MTSQFNHYIKSMPNPNLVDVFIPLHELEQQRLDIIQKGIKFNPKKGLRFHLNHLKVDETKEGYEFVHVVIALGKVLKYKTPLSALNEGSYENPSNATAANLLDGFDSLKISDNGEYMIFYANQVDTLHLIKVGGGKNISHEDPCVNICDNCSKPNAVLYCVQDSMKLCTACDEKIHKASEILKKHTRVPLGEAMVKNQKCPEHPDHNVEYYCMKCHQPICMECKVCGSHSRSGANKHKLISIGEAYETQGRAVVEPNPIRVNRAKALKTAITETKNTIADVQKNLEQTIEEIQRVAQKAIEDARVQAGQRILVAQSALDELERKADELKAQRAIVAAYYTSGEPVDFLRAYHNNELLDNEIESSLDLQTCKEVEADLTVFGSLEVGPKEAKQQLQKRSIAPQNASINSHSHIEEADEEEEIKYTTLTKMASRKARKYEEAGRQLIFQPFEGSQILTDAEAARKLYLCFPFKAMPETHLLFSTAGDGRSVSQMHRLVDNMGITVTLIRANGRVFGGFAASKWNADGTAFGDGSSSFLFSIDNDAFIGVRPQSEDPVYLLGTKETFSFGRDDLVLAGDFDRCASTIENTFGVGLKYGGEEAQKFLAGKPRFAADEVEVWGFFSPK